MLSLVQCQLLQAFAEGTSFIENLFLTVSVFQTNSKQNLLKKIRQADYVLGSDCFLVFDVPLHSDRAGKVTLGFLLRLPAGHPFL